MTDTKETTEINLQEIVGILVHNLWLIAGAAIVGALMAFLLTELLITPQYAASASLYVYNTDKRETITQSDITTSQKLVETYIVIMQSDAVLSQVAEESALGYTAKEIKEMFSATAINNTEVFQLTIKNSQHISRGSAVGDYPGCQGRLRGDSGQGGPAHVAGLAQYGAQHGCGRNRGTGCVYCHSGVEGDAGHDHQDSGGYQKADGNTDYRSHTDDQCRERKENTIRESHK